MSTISFPITLDTKYYKKALPKIQGLSPSLLTGAGGRSNEYTYTLASSPVLFNNPDVVPLSPIIGSLTNQQLMASMPSPAAGRNLLLQAGSFVPIENTSYEQSLAYGMAFAGTRPVGDSTISIILPTSLLTADGSASRESAKVKIFCSLDSSGWPNLVVESDTGASYMYPLPNDLPFFIFNFAVTAPGGAVFIPTVSKPSIDMNPLSPNNSYSVLPGGGSGASIQITAVLFTRPYTDDFTYRRATDSIEIIYTLADHIARRSSSAIGYDFDVSDPESCNGIDTVEIKANLSWSTYLSNSYHTTYQLSTILPGGVPYIYYTKSGSVKNKVTQFLERAGKWTTTFTDPSVFPSDMEEAQFMSILIAGSPTMVYPTKKPYLFDKLENLGADYDELNKYGLCHIHPCTEFNPEGLFYTPVFQSSEQYTSVLQDVTTVNLDAVYYGVPGKPSIFSNSPSVDMERLSKATTWYYSNHSNELLPGVGATGAYGFTGSGLKGELASQYLKKAGPAAIVINL